MEKPLRIGVLAVQGNFREHATVLRRLGAEPVEVRLPEQLEGLDGLIIPGGESTAIGRLMRLYGLDEAVRGFGGPMLRAPWLEEAGPDVEVLAEVDGHPVLAREGRLLVAAFHPELTDDTRVHERFLNIVREESGVRA
jgi:5'-phosphate synthase pdxT subunit